MRKRKFVEGCTDCERERKAIPRARIRKAAKILGCTVRELAAQFKAARKG